MRDGSLRFWGGLFLLAAGLNICAGWHGWGAVVSGHLADPDGYMRLERIREGVAAGHLVNRVARDGSGAGVLVGWSKLLDLLLWVMAAPLAPLLGWTAALFAAGVALGPLAAGALGVALAFAAQPLAEDRLLWAAAVAAALLPGLAAFAVPGEVDDRMLLAALTAASLGCLLRAARGSGGYGFLGGAAGGFAIWLTPEALPFILPGFAAVLACWLRPGQARLGTPLLLCGAGFVDVLGFGYAIDPPAGGYLADEAGRISGAYFMLGLLALIGGQALQRLGRRPDRTRRLAGFGIALLLMVVWIAWFPKLAEGLWWQFGDDDRRWAGAWTAALAARGGGDFLAFLLPGVLAFAYALWRGVAGRSWPWVYAALCTLLALALAGQFRLAAVFPAAIAAALLPVAMSEAGRRWRARPGFAAAVRLGVLAAVLAPPALPALARPGAAAGPSCDLRRIGRLLGGEAGVIVLAEPEDTPELLYRTPVETVGSLYQPSAPGLARELAAWGAAPGDAEPAAVAATGAKLVLVCPAGGGRAPASPAGTLRRALDHDTPPPWLSPRAADPATGWRLYAIDP